MRKAPAGTHAEAIAQAFYQAYVDENGGDVSLARREVSAIRADGRTKYVSGEVFAALNGDGQLRKNGNMEVVKEENNPYVWSKITVPSGTGRGGGYVREREYALYRRGLNLLRQKFGLPPLPAANNAPVKLSEGEAEQAVPPSELAEGEAEQDAAESAAARSAAAAESAVPPVLKNSDADDYSERLGYGAWALIHGMVYQLDSLTSARLYEACVKNILYMYPCQACRENAKQAPVQAVLSKFAAQIREWQELKAAAATLLGITKARPGGIDPEEIRKKFKIIAFELHNAVSVAKGHVKDERWLTLTREDDIVTAVDMAWKP